MATDDTVRDGSVVMVQPVERTLENLRPGNPVQEAIANAKDGDTILIADGVYGAKAQHPEVLEWARAVILREESIHSDHLLRSDLLVAAEIFRDAFDAETTQLLSMFEIERRHVERVLILVKENKSAAARTLGFDRRTLYRKLDAYARADAKKGAV